MDLGMTNMASEYRGLFMTLPNAARGDRSSNATRPRSRTGSTSHSSIRLRNAMPYSSTHSSWPATGWHANLISPVGFARFRRRWRSRV